MQTFSQLLHYRHNIYYLDYWTPEIMCCMSSFCSLWSIFIRNLQARLCVSLCHTFLHKIFLFVLFGEHLNVIGNVILRFRCVQGSDQLYVRAVLVQNILALSFQKKSYILLNIKKQARDLFRSIWPACKDHSHESGQVDINAKIPWLRHLNTWHIRGVVEKRWVVYFGHSDY